MRRFFFLSLIGLFCIIFKAQLLCAAPYAYITNFGSNDLTVVDTTSQAVVTTIPVGVKPQGIVANLNKTRVYIANSGSDTVSVVDTISNSLMTTIPAGDYPIGLAMQIDGSYILVTNGGDGTVVLINTATYATMATIDVGESPVGVAVTPDGTKAYVVNFRSNNVSVIDLLTRLVVKTIPVGYHPQVVFIDPRGEKAYVTNSGADSVSVIKTATDSVIATIPVGRAPQCLAMSMDGTKVYVTNYYDNTVSVIAAATHAEIARFAVGLGPQGIDVDLQDTVYVANFESNNVSVVDNITYNVLASLPAGQSPMAFGRFIGGNPIDECTCIVSPCPPPPPGCLEGGGLVLKINQVDVASCPTIQLYFTVTDLNGDPVTGLTNSNFSLSENFIQCPTFDVVSAESVSEPAAVVVTMDYSGSMSGQPLQDSQDAAVRFVQTMDAQDVVEVIKFSNSYEVVQSFTANKNFINTVITSPWPGGGGSTSLYDAVYQAITNVASQTSRKAVIVITDGRDNTSAHSLDGVIAYAQQNHVPVFAVGLGKAIELALKRLAHETGGAYYYAPTSSDLLAIYGQIARVIRSQYSATYTTCVATGSVHNLSLNVYHNGKTGSDSRQFTACSMVTTNECTAELAQDLKIHIPVIGCQSIFGMAYLWADLQYQDRNDGNIWFRVISGGQQNAMDIGTCQAAAYSPTSGIIHVPDIIYRNEGTQLSLWTDFEYVPTSDNFIWLKLTGYGLN